MVVIKIFSLQKIKINNKCIKFKASLILPACDGLGIRLFKKWTNIVTQHLLLIHIIAGTISLLATALAVVSATGKKYTFGQEEHMFGGCF